MADYSDTDTIYWYSRPHHDVPAGTSSANYDAQPVAVQKPISVSAAAASANYDAVAATAQLGTHYVAVVSASANYDAQLVGASTPGPTEHYVAASSATAVFTAYDVRPVVQGPTLTTLETAVAHDTVVAGAIGLDTFASAVSRSTSTAAFAGRDDLVGTPVKSTELSLAAAGNLWASIATSTLIEAFRSVTILAAQPSEL